MTPKEKREHARLHRRIMNGQKVTRREISRAFELKRMADAERDRAERAES